MANTQKFIIAKALENLLLQDDPQSLEKMQDPNADIILLGMEWTRNEAEEALGRISEAIKEALQTQADLMQLEFQNALGAFAPLETRPVINPQLSSNVIDLFNTTLN